MFADVLYSSNLLSLLTKQALRSDNDNDFTWYVTFDLRK